MATATLLLLSASLRTRPLGAQERPASPALTGRGRHGHRQDDRQGCHQASRSPTRMHVLHKLFTDRYAARETFDSLSGSWRRTDGAGPPPTVGADACSNSLNIRAGLGLSLALIVLLIGGPALAQAAPPADAPTGSAPAGTVPATPAGVPAATPPGTPQRVGSVLRVDGPCVIVDIAGHRAGYLDCAAWKLQAAARTAQAQTRGGLDVTDARSPDTSTGVASQTATRERMGNAFGVSVHPQRPVAGSTTGPLFPTRGGTAP